MAKSYLLDGRRVQIGSKAEERILAGRERPLYSNMESLRGGFASERRKLQPFSIASSETGETTLKQLRDTENRLRGQPQPLTPAPTGEQPQDTGFAEFINPNTEQTQKRPLSTLTPSEVENLASQGYQFSGGEGNIPSFISGSQQLGQLQPSLDFASQELEKAKKMLTDFSIEGDPEFKRITDVTNRGYDRRQDLINEQAQAAKKAGEFALGSARNFASNTGRYSASGQAVPSMVQSAISSNERKIMKSMQELQEDREEALLQARRSYEAGKWSEYVDLVRIAEDSYNTQIDKYLELQKEINKENEVIRKEQETLKSKEADKITDLIKEAAKSGASQEVIDAIATAGTFTEAVKAAGSSLVSQVNTGIIGEYNLYKKEGGTLGFDEYQTRDANRKITAAQAAASIGGLTPAQTQNFLRISDKFQADKVMESANRGKTAIDIANQVIANPSSAGNQLSMLYTLVKSLDPDSAVREGELDLAQKTQSYLGKYETTLNRIAKGQLISPQATKELAEATKALAKTWYDAGQRREKQYKSQANTAGVGGAFNSYLGEFERPYNERQLEDEMASKQAVDAFVVENPDKVEMIAKMYDVEGVTDQDILDYLKQSGLLQ